MKIEDYLHNLKAALNNATKPDSNYYHEPEENIRGRKSVVKDLLDMIEAGVFDDIGQTECSFPDCGCASARICMFPPANKIAVDFLRNK